MEFDDILKERHSVRRFSTKKPKYDDIIEAISAANTSPLAGNIPTLRFILVTEKPKIEKIEEACQQDFISKVDFLVVVCSDKTQCVRSYEKQGEIYSRQQAGAAIENFLLKITDMKLASCWVGLFVEHIIKHTLEIPDNIDIEAVLPIGYEMLPKSKQRKKRSLDSVLFFNKWKNQYLKPWKTPEAI